MDCGTIRSGFDTEWSVIMLEFVPEGFWWGALWLAMGWHVPQPIWTKWVQEKLVDGYYWVKDKIQNR